MAMTIIHVPTGPPPPQSATHGGAGWARGQAACLPRAGREVKTTGTAPSVWFYPVLTNQL
jgi:hypothetical protein